MKRTFTTEESEQPTEGQGIQEKGKLVPTSLAEFLLADKAPARRFVQLLSKRPALTDEDLARSHAIVDAEPARLGRVVELARAAAATLSHAGLLLRWCEDIVRTRHETLRGWALDPNQDAEVTFLELLNWAYPVIQTKGDRAKRQLAEYSLLLGLNLLIARRSLAPLDALRSAASATGMHAAGRGIAPIERATTKQITRAGIKQLFDLARITALSESHIAAAENGRDEALILVGKLRRERDAVEAEMDVLRAEAQSQVQELEQRDQRIRELSADLEGVRVRAHQDLNELKARFRRHLGDSLTGLLADAWDAIDTEPPHPTVARERLETAREAIRKELEWLSKSSD